MHDHKRNFNQRPIPTCLALVSKLTSACLAIGFLFISVAHSHGQSLFNNNFDQHSAAGLYTEEQWENDFAEPDFEDGIREGRVSLVTGAAAFGGQGTSLAVAYPKGKVGTKETGAQWKSFLPQAVEEASLSYRVKFSEGFDFVRGGKLPGLAGGTAPTGSKQADGFNGWAGRLMWRTEFKGTPGSPQQLTSGGISYAKHVNSGFAQDGRQEDRVFWVNVDGQNTSLTSNVWYEIKQRVVMNTPGVKDGVLQIWLDGNLVLDQDDIEYRKTAELKIDQFYFSTFFGGNSSGWATSKNETIFFDDIQVSAPQNGPATLTVPGQHPTIQAAIDAASPGDRIVISDGVYRQNVVVDKSLEITATKQTFLVGIDRSRAALLIQAADVKISTLDTRRGLYGIEIAAGCTGVQLTEVDARRAERSGIKVGAHADRVHISESIAIDNLGDGITIIECADATVADCICVGNAGRGIFLSDVSGFQIDSNRVNKSGGAGIEVFGNHGLVSENVALRSLAGPGIYLAGGNNALIDNWSTGNSLIGILLTEGDGLFVSGNVMNSNRLNLIANNVHRSMFEQNRIRRADLGVIVENSGDNVFESNQVLENSVLGFFLAPTSSRTILRNNRYFKNAFGNDVVDAGVNNQIDSE